MKLEKGTYYRWRTRVRYPAPNPECRSAIIEHDDIRVVVARAMQVLGLGWHPPAAPWFYSEATKAKMSAVRSPFLQD